MPLMETGDDGRGRWALLAVRAYTARAASWAVAASCLALLPAAAGAKLQSISAFSLGYSVRFWGVDDGLPAPGISALAQTADGYLWVGTNGGLVRFNGHEFRARDGAPKPDRENVAGLFADSGGRLWIAGVRGRLSLLDGDRRSEFGAPEGLEAAGASSLRIVETSPDKILLAGSNRDGLFMQQFSDGRFRSILAAPHPREASTPVGWVVSPDDVLWGSSVTGQLWRIDGDAIEMVPLDGTQVGYPFTGRDGKPRLASGSGAWVLEDSEWKLERPARDGGDTAINWWDCAEDDAGNLWLGTTQHGIVVHLPDGQRRRLSVDGVNFPTNCRTVLRDRQGSLWVGSAAGLFQFFRSPVLSLPFGDRRGDPRVFAVSEDGEGRVWIGGPRGVEFIEPQQPLRAAPIPGEAGEIWTLSGDPSGAGAYVGSRNGLVWRQQTDTHDIPQLNSGKPAANISNLVASADGEVWYSAVGGTLRWRPPAPPEWITPGSPEDVSDANQLVRRDPDGRLYRVDRREGLLFRRAEHRWEQLHRIPDMDGRWVTHMAIAPDGDVIVLVGSSRIFCWRGGSWLDRGMLPADLFGSSSLEVDEDGDLWMASFSDGVLWVDGEALERRAAAGDPGAVNVPFRFLDRDDGLASKACSGREDALARGRDGRIWVATARGISVIDPPEWRRALVQSEETPVRIESVRIDAGLVPGASSFESTSNRVEMAPGATSVEFRFVGLDLRAPANVRYRYKLEGYDDDWVDGGTERVARYRKLPPGEYLFRVTAAGYTRADRGSETRLAFFVHPAWWQRTAVRAAGGALALALLGLFGHRQARRLRERHERQREYARQLLATQEDERRRIAHELHDSLGQDLLLIKNSNQLVSSKVDADSPLRPRLDRIAELASAALDSVRTITQNLRPPELDRLGLEIAVCAMAETLEESTGIAVHCDVAALDDAVRPDDEIVVYRMVQESLNNVVKHAGATRVQIEARREKPGVVLTIRDDGRGFSAIEARSPNRARGLGLAGLRSRAETIGGSVRIDASPGTGVAVHIEFPCPDEGIERESPGGR